MIDIVNLEIHIAHSCNLFCNQCTHYSNFSHKGILSSEEADKQMGLWSDRINPRMFSMLGGEPAVNKDLCDIIKIARKHWKNKMQLVSNGFLLKNHPDLPKVLVDTDCNLEISVHHSSKEYQKKFQKVNEMLLTWKDKHDIKLNIRQSVERWTRTYLGSGKDMKPYNDNQQRKSWSVCRAKWCPQIYDGKIWKCPQLAYLPMQLEKMGLTDDEDWKPYLKYKPISPDASYEKLSEFLKKEDESFCKMCAANPESFKLQNPLIKHD